MQLVRAGMHCAAFRATSRLSSSCFRSLRFSSDTMAAPSVARGAFILFEGIDRSGKTTQCNKLVEHIVTSLKVDADLWRFPDRTTVLGQMINSYLTDSRVQLNPSAVHLLFAANRWEKSEALLQTLDSGKTLVVDRYSYSGMAYTLAKQLPGLDLQWCQGPERGLPAPDLVFYMRVSPEASAQRGGYGEERYEKADFQRKVAAEFDALQGPNWVTIDADQPINVIHQQIVDATEALYGTGRLQRPVAKLFQENDHSLGDATVNVELGSQMVKGQQAGQPHHPSSKTRTA